MVGNRSRDWSRGFAAGLVLAGDDGRRIEIGLESAAVAASRFLAGRGAPVGNPEHGRPVLDAFRIAEVLVTAGSIFSLCTVL